MRPPYSPLNPLNTMTSVVEPTQPLLNLGYQLGLIGFTRLSNIIRLSHYAIGTHPRYLLRLLLVVSSSVVSLPLRLAEKIFYGRKITQTQLENPPIFIIGHWRSGTTYLHNLMTQDPHFGYLSMYQAVVPDCSLIGHNWLRQLLAKIMPIKRPMDNVLWPMEGPQEDEVALAKVMATGFYTQFLFPSKARHLFRKFVLMEGASAKDADEFKRSYLQLMKVATIKADGKPLILKNPVNTARIRLLLELFPDAKFVHIHRSPYDVFKSASYLHQKLSVLTTLQTIDTQRADETVLILYEEMMQRYLQDRALIPAGNLVEVRYEDLESRPMDIIQRIYSELDLPSFEENIPTFEAFLEAQKSYQKNNFALSAEAKQKVEQHWGFALSEFGYSLPV